MAKIYRPFMVIGLIILVIMGLNTSNHGINQLTMESRAPVIGLSVDSDDPGVFLLGEKHEIDQDKYIDYISIVWGKTKIMLQQVKNYLLRIWIIFKAVFLN